MPFKGNVTATIGKTVAPSLGKKGTSSDVTLYNFKLQDSVLSFVEPSSYPDKIQSLVSSLNMADQVVLKMDAVDVAFAETVVALDALGMGKGYLIMGGGAVEDTIKAFAKDSVISSYPVVGEQVVELREKLSKLEVDSSGDAIVQIDHSFSVKGVGTVALGVVKKGVLHKHDELTIYPEKRKVLAKSIQVQDTDVEEAAAGVRLGLALKDVSPEDVSRGRILSTSDSIESTNALEVDLTLSKYSPRQVGEGDVFLVNAWLNYVQARVVSGSVSKGETKKVKLSLEKELAIMPGRIALLDPSQKMPRVLGFANLR